MQILSGLLENIFSFNKGNKEWLDEQFLVMNKLSATFVSQIKYFNQTYLRSRLIS